jgi:hypothetical protein
VLGRVEEEEEGERGRCNGEDEESLSLGGEKIIYRPGG